MYNDIELFVPLKKLQIGRQRDKIRISVVDCGYFQNKIWYLELFHASIFFYEDCVYI